VVFPRIREPTGAVIVVGPTTLATVKHYPAATSGPSTAVPEPGTALLLAFGMVGAGLLARRRALIYQRELARRRRRGGVAVLLTRALGAAPRAVSRRRASLFLARQPIYPASVPFSLAFPPLLVKRPISRSTQQEQSLWH
jgi:hypothetical protein